MPPVSNNNRRAPRQPQAVAVSADGKLQPQAPKIEEAVLGALMLEKDAYSLVSEILTPDTFYEFKHQLIYTAIQELALKQNPIDILTVTNQLSADGVLEQVGGAYYVSTLTENVGSAAHVEYHAKIIAQKALARQLITYAGEISAGAFDETSDIEQLMQKAEAELFQLSRHNIKKDTQQIDPLITEALEKIEAASNRAEGLSGLPTGFTELDNITSGWQNTDLIIIAARPAMGKTAFALSMVKNMAVNYGIHVGMFSLEMSNLQLVNRLLQNTCEITGDKVKSGRLTPDEWTQLTTRIKNLQGAPIFVDDTPSLSVFELRTKARRLVKEHGVQIIMIDYLQLMNASGMQFGSREQEVSNISRSLKGLAKELNIPIIALSQLNRGVENRQGGAQRPQLSDLRESGAIEQDADMVCFIHRPEYYKIYEDEKGNDLRGLAEIIIAKHRNGAVGDVRLRFRGEFVRFQNLDEDTSIQSTMTPYPKDGTTLESRMNNFGAASDNSAQDAFLSAGKQEDPPF